MRSSGHIDSGLSGTGVFLAVSLVVTAVLVAVFVAPWSDDEPDGRATDSAGAVVDETDETDETAAEAACDPVLSQPADKNRHIDDRPLTYPEPPSFGHHSSRWAVLSPPFYSVADRPDVAVLVHNLEHGYNILWYDETVVDDATALAQVRTMAREYAGRDRDPARAFIAAPWTVQDGGSMPEGRHYALTHWYADPDDRSRSRQDEVGYTMYCSSVTPDVVRQWMRDYPLEDSPEGHPVNM
jgi:hypothetical protein